MEPNKLLEGKKGLIFGVANKHSIAWAIAEAAAQAGARLAFNYQNDRLKDNVAELASSLDGAAPLIRVMSAAIPRLRPL
jgi:enoyl-[acyl-carrier protein] reductase I